MAVKTFYRGRGFVKDYIIKYLNRIFYRHDAGALTFSDGHKSVEFSSKPVAAYKLSWDFKDLPVVLFGSTSVTYRDVGINPSNLNYYPTDVTDDVDTPQYGGDIDMTLEMSVRARTIDEVDNLTDIVCFYLTHPDFRTHMLRHGVGIPEPPRTSGEGIVTDIKSRADYPVYETRLTMPVTSIWRFYEDTPDFVQTILVEVTGYAD